MKNASCLVNLYIQTIPSVDGIQNSKKYRLLNRQDDASRAFSSIEQGTGVMRPLNLSWSFTHNPRSTRALLSVHNKLAPFAYPPSRQKCMDNPGSTEFMTRGSSCFRIAAAK